MSVEQPVEALPIGKDKQGVYRIAGTRVTLASLIAYFRQGYTAEDLAESFPSVSLENIYLAIGQYLRHQPEYDSYLNVQNEAAERVRMTIESKPGYKELRERLLAARTVVKE